MADSEVPQVGDQVSWAYGGGRPGGEVAEKKDEGEIAIQSKRGNTIKRNAEPDNPAVHVSRPGNDVVKRQSELDVEEKGEGGGEATTDDNATADEKPEGGLGVPATNGDQKEKSKSPAPKKTPATKKSPATAKEKSPAVSKKRKAAEEEKPDEDAEEEASIGEEPPAKKARGRPKGTGTPKAAATAPPAAKEKKTPGRKAGAPKKADAPKESLGEEEPSKKGRGRPKGSGGAGAGAKKEKKKAPAKAVNGTVGSRTRSTKK